MRKIEKINRSHSPSVIRAAATAAVAEAIRLQESRADDADRLGFGDKGSGVATVLYIKHADGGVSSRQLRGNRGRRGRSGVPGIIGREGRTGLMGGQGGPGVKGAVGDIGPLGLQGRQGEPGPVGEPGPIGPQGERGPLPRHKWNGTRLAFENPDGSFGRSVQLQGPGGGRGGRGSSGSGSMAFVQERFDLARSMAFFLGT